MPSTDTVPFKITLNTKEELKRIKEIVSKEVGLNPEDISWKQAEIILRIKALNGKITIPQIKNVLIGKIR